MVFDSRFEAEHEFILPVKDSDSWCHEGATFADELIEFGLSGDDL